MNWYSIGVVITAAYFCGREAAFGSKDTPALTILVTLIFWPIVLPYTIGKDSRKAGD